MATRHPPPASRATARGVLLDRPSPILPCHTTRPQPHEQLLVGWLVGGMTTGRRHGEHRCHQPPRRANSTTQQHDDDNRGSGRWTTWPRTTTTPTRTMPMDDTPTWPHDTPSEPGREGRPSPRWPPRMHDDYAGRGTTTDGETTTGSRRHTTHSQPHEQLLVGWRVGDTMPGGRGMRGRGQRGGWGMTMGDATTTTAASICMQGGRVRVERRGGAR